MNRIRKFLNSPFPTAISSIDMLRKCLLFSVFVFAFLFIFRPFGLVNLQFNFTLTILGYALICLLVMLILNLGIPRLTPGFFAENNWTSGKEILWTLVNIGSIGLANAIYSSAIGLFPLDLRMIMVFETYTLLVGLIPVSVTVMIRRERLEKQFSTQSSELNLALETKNAIQPDPIQESVIVEIGHGSSKDNLNLHPDDIVFMRSADNYVDVWFLESSALKYKTIRSSMKEMEDLLANLPQFFRCHKSYLVNLEKVVHVSGNAQGLKLELRHTDDLIPVSRNYTKLIREKLANHP